MPQSDTMPIAVPADALAAGGEFERVAEAMAEHRRAEESRRAMWRTHHRHDQYDRCVTIRGRRVCRRCITLYPTSLVVAALSLAGVVLWPVQYDLWLIWGLCLPGTLDFVLEQTGVVRYSARRQVWVTLLVALALGRGFAYEIQSRWSWEFWGPVLVFSTAWFVAAVVGSRRSGRPASAGTRDRSVG